MDLRNRFRDQLKFGPLRYDSSLAKHLSLIPAVSESVADDATNLLSGNFTCRLSGSNFTSR